MRYAPTSTSTSTRSDASGVMVTRGHELLLIVDVGGDGMGRCLTGIVHHLHEHTESNVNADFFNFEF